MAKDSVHLNIQTQLDEFEVIQAMFCGNGEKVIMLNKTPFTEASYFLSGHINAYNSTIAYVLHQNITSSEDERNLNYKVHCSYPSDYPLSAPPKVRVICDRASKTSHTSFDKKLSEFIDTIEPGEQCMFEIIQWIQENINKFIQFSDQLSSKEAKSTAIPTASEQPFARIWIYSHHIYSTVKRKNIIDWAEELHLTGFSLPGKPGVICVEGNCAAAEEYYSRLKALNWKRLTCKLKEDLGSAPSAADRDFQTFQEINYDPHGHRDYHMDLGMFFQFLKNHGQEDKFQLLFGIQGRESK